MKTLFRNGTVINVFTGELERVNVLTENGIIQGAGDYNASEADEVIDIAGRYLCPGFIDGHIHIESSMLLPAEFARAALPHGTTAVIADPHEIANVCGRTGVEFMLKASEGLPLTVYIALPSCVPSTEFDEAGAALGAAELEEFYSHPRVIGLGEVMDYGAVIKRDGAVMKKINDALTYGLSVNGHAPLLSGKQLDRYVSAGITDDHECSYAGEAIERIRKGQRVMIREGTAARNLSELLPLFDEPYASRCLLVTDDKHPADLINNGHIDDIIRKAVRGGKSAITGIRMATLRAAEYFGLRNIGAVAPGYIADLIVLDDIDKLKVSAVYKNGVKVAENGQAFPFPAPSVDETVRDTICRSFHLPALGSEDFIINGQGVHSCRVINIMHDRLLTDETVCEVDFSSGNGIDVNADRLKIAVIERHNRTGHIGRGFISGVGLKEGAIASSVAHDSHNLIVIGTNEDDMAFAANRVRELQGGAVVVKDGAVIAEMPLPYGGLMTDASAADAARLNENVRSCVHGLGVPKTLEPFMTMAFVSLPVIPHIKITSRGLVDVDSFSLIPLFCD